MSDDDDLPDEETALEQPTIDAASRSGQKRAENRKKRAQREASEFWSAVFATPVGRREMWDILKQMHPFEQKFGCTDVGFPDQCATWTALGEQLLGLRIYQTWDHSHHDGVRLMLEENDPRFKKLEKQDDNG